MIIGIDVGTRQDHTAITWLDNWKINRIERLPLGLEYPVIIERLRPLILCAEHAFIDAGGVGDPVCSTLQADYPQLIGIKITAGSSAATSGNSWTVPKALLMQTFLHGLSTRVKITAVDPGRSQLRDELLAFQHQGGTRSGAKSGKHDDLVLSAALAVFGAAALTANDQHRGG